MEIIYSFVLNAGHVLLYYLLPFVIVLGIMVFFHELGHFLVAKFFGVKVEKFALGFGPKIVGKVAGETEYSIRYVPLGGFVKMLGEDVEEEDDAQEELSPEEAERAFNNKHPLKRIAIVGAGPFFNLILAFLLFFGSYFVAGEQVLTPEIGEVTAGSPAQEAGLLKGDIILSIEGKELMGWDLMQDIIQKSAGIPLLLEIKRGNNVLTVTVIPDATVVKNIFKEDKTVGRIGIRSTGKYIDTEIGPVEAIKKGFLKTWMWIKLTILVIIKLFQGIVPANTIGGPILIGQMTGEIVKEDVSFLIPFMAIISVNLGILNLFPIPILDGGLIVFLFLELMIGKPLSVRKREIAQKIGLSLLVLLMAFVFYNDIFRLIKQIL